MLHSEIGWNQAIDSGDKVENVISLQTDAQAEKCQMTGDHKSLLELSAPLS